MATTSPPGKQDVYAVVRLDSFRNFTPRPENVTVRKVVHRLAEAELEVRHLNMTAPTGTVYFVQRTTVSTKEEPVGAPASLSTAEPSSLPQRRRARAEKRPAKKVSEKRA